MAGNLSKRYNELLEIRNSRDIVSGWNGHSSIEVGVTQLSKLVDDLTMQLATIRNELRPQGVAMPSEILDKAHHIAREFAQLRQFMADLEAERESLEAIAQIGRVISSSLDLPTVLNEVIDTIIELTGAERAFLMLRDDSGNMRTVIARNWEKESIRPQEYEISQSIVKDVAVKGRAVLTTNARKDPRFDQMSSVIAYNLRSILCEPIKLRNDLKGVIYADNRVREGLFGPKEQQLLNAIANQAAVAIENAQLYQALQQHAQDLETRVAERTEELAEANRRLRALSRLKDQFVANVSHELRTPISSLNLYASLLKQGNNDPRKYIQAIDRETNRLEHIIESLLRLSSMEQTQAPMESEAVDLNSIAQDLISDRQPLAENRNLQLMFEKDDGLPSIQGDCELLTEALSIIITNALNYTPANGKVCVQTLQVERDGLPWVAVSVSDTGPGIHDDDLPHLFERFYRGQAGIESGSPGTGLGLAIVKEIIDRHDGLIEVQGNPNETKGALFRLLFPI